MIIFPLKYHFREKGFSYGVLCKMKVDEETAKFKSMEYYLFDAGMSVAFLILRATELGIVAHPIAGCREEQA